jgi:beta-lactamase class D
MNKIVPLLTVLLVFCIASSGYGEDYDIANIFKSKGINGTTVMSSLDGTKTYIHNDEQANQRVLPASTFKIPNTLIALEEGAVADGKEIIKWDGIDKGMAAWNKDQSIETAFPASCVWFYQELAKRVGKDKYEFYVKKMKYGNEQTGQDVTTFWLKGDLKISPVEQIAFLKKIYTREYSFKPSSYDLLRKIMITEQTPTFSIRAKTGWAATQRVGWIVGYVESGDQVWFFATNIEIEKPQDLHLRQEVTIGVLKLKGII